MTIPPSSGPVAFRLRRPYDDAEAFVAGDGPAITRSGMVLVGAGPRPVGLIVRFEIALRDGTALFRGEGRVVGHRASADEMPAGLELRFTRLDARGKSLVDQIVMTRGEKPDGSLPPPSRSSASLSPATLPPLSLRSAAPRPSQLPSASATPVIPDLRVPSLPPDLLAAVDPHPQPLSSSVERGAPTSGEPAVPHAADAADVTDATDATNTADTADVAAEPPAVILPESTPTATSPESTLIAAPLETQDASTFALPLSTELERGPGGEGEAGPGGEADRDALLGRLRGRSKDHAATPPDRDALLARLRGRSYGRRRREQRGERGRRAR